MSLKTSCRQTALRMKNKLGFFEQNLLSLLSPIYFGFFCAKGQTFKFNANLKTAKKVGGVSLMLILRHFIDWIRTVFTSATISTLFA